MDMHDKVSPGNEPGRRTDRPGCGATGERPGQGGGCAFRGAKLALQPIADVAHLVHGPITCQGHSWDSRPTGSSGARLHRSTFITDLGELDVIYGGEPKLARAIAEIAAKYDPAAIFVYQTCLPAMIGDDVAAVCKAAAARCGRPVIPVIAPGFAGDKDYGNEFAGGVLLDRVIGSAEPEELTGADINIIGEYNVAGELGQIAPLLRELGIRVLASIPGDGRFAAIARSHRARAAVSLCSRALANLARRMRERLGIDYVEGSFYGISNTSGTLRALAVLLAERGGPADLPARAEALVKREEARAWSLLAACRRRLEGKRVLLATGGVKSWSLVSALREAGLTVVGTSMHKSTERDRQKALTATAGGGCLYDDLSAQNMDLLLQDGHVDVVLSGFGGQFTAARARAAWVEINHHRRLPLTGYAGMVRLVADIDRACASPVFGQARSRAPWDQTVLGPGSDLGRKGFGVWPG
jgi:nitrogenase molybdenum-cofactor synthesis protein NifE